MIRDLREAEEEIQNEAAQQGIEYLETALPKTLEAIRFMVNQGLNKDKIMATVANCYGVTKEKIRGNIEMVVDFLIRERGS